MYCLTLFSVLLFTLGIRSPVAFGACVVAENLTKIQWDSWDCEQKWYLTITTNDALSHHISGDMITNIKKHGDIVTIEGIQFSKEYKAVPYNGRLIHQPSGTYRWNIDTGFAETKYISEHDAAGHLDQAAVDEFNHFLTEDLLVLSYSKTHMCFVYCNNQKEWTVWVFTTTLEPTPSDIIDVLTALRSNGIHENMHFTDCRGALDHYCQICH